mmetsp:Transcript_46897/g.147057  ORF Transcript_46897/g.147057 Transcript_46897/m.147057 type:complete len:169 (+) Transcript_46897:278-784(+)
MEFQGPELATLAWSYAQLVFHHQPLFEAIAAESRKMLAGNRMDGFAAGMVLQGLASAEDLSLALLLFWQVDACGLEPGALGFGALLGGLERRPEALHHEFRLLRGLLVRGRGGVPVPGEPALAVAAARLAEVAGAGPVLHLLSPGWREGRAPLPGLAGRVRRACGSEP